MIIWLITLLYDKRRAKKAERRAIEQLSHVASASSAGSTDRAGTEAGAGPSNSNSREEYGDGDIKYNSENTALYSNAKGKNNKINQKPSLLRRTRTIDDDVLVLDVEIHSPSLTYTNLTCRPVMIGQEGEGGGLDRHAHDRSMICDKDHQHTQMHTQQWVTEKGW